MNIKSFVSGWNISVVSHTYPRHTADISPLIARNFRAVQNFIFLCAKNDVGKAHAQGRHWPFTGSVCGEKNLR